MEKKAPRKSAKRRASASTDRIVITVKVRADLHNRGRHYAFDHGLTWGDVLDEALEDYLKKKGA